MQEVAEFYKRTRVTEALLELRNITTLAALTVRLALDRRESRGLHYTLDCSQLSRPAEDTVVSVWEMWGLGLPVIDV